MENLSEQKAKFPSVGEWGFVFRLRIYLLAQPVETKALFILLWLSLRTEKNESQEIGTYDNEYCLRNATEGLKEVCMRPLAILPSNATSASEPSLKSVETGVPIDVELKGKTGRQSSLMKGCLWCEVVKESR